MIYFVIGTIVVTALGIALYTAIFESKYIWKLLSIEVICASIVSCYIFYYIGMYQTTGNDINLDTTIERTGDGSINMIIDVKWNKKPEIFGFDGEDDLLVLRFSADDITPVYSDKPYKETENGKCAVELSDEYEEYKYFKIEKNEKEIYFGLEDGVDNTINITLKESKPQGTVKVFYLHDYKKPLEETEYWEKDRLVEIK